ncbi:unnamed protein product [Phytophthora fragariaefolia]|uniref:Unnamed protein product n=1 Tax=Phytophthora fragariaefolia TaxID=1490495 RepID=A0A9W6XSP6_9STRA|nr:unnamed protein product [Phytophthora fragariaefolia]
MASEVTSNVLTTGPAAQHRNITAPRPPLPQFNGCHTSTVLPRRLVHRRSSASFRADCAWLHFPGNGYTHLALSACEPTNSSNGPARNQHGAAADAPEDGEPRAARGPSQLGAVGLVLELLDSRIPELSFTHSPNMNASEEDKNTKSLHITRAAGSDGNPVVLIKVHHEGESVASLNVGEARVFRVRVLSNHAGEDVS